MFIHLKRGEKLYVNGAVVRVDRRTSLEFLNDVSFLLENHVMQAENANTPVRQLYFVVQSMLMEPSKAAVTIELYKHLAHRTRQTLVSDELGHCLDLVERNISTERYYDALKDLRACFALEQTILTEATIERKASVQ